MKYQTECIVCKKVFPTNVSKELFCCDKCLDKWLNENRNISLLKTIKPNRLCIECSILFPIKSIDKRFCSIKCKDKNKYKKNKVKYRNWLRSWRKKNIKVPVAQPDGASVL